MQRDNRSTVTAILRKALHRHPKRNGAMVGFAIAVVLLSGRVLLRGPAPATASVPGRVPSQQRPVPAAPARSRSNPSVIDWLGEPRKAVNRNLFIAPLSDYPPATVSPGNQEDGEGGNDRQNPSDEKTDHRGEQRPSPGNVPELGWEHHLKC